MTDYATGGPLGSSWRPLDLTDCGLAEPSGTATVTRQADGTITVEADDVIGISFELLDQLDTASIRVLGGLLVLDTAGEYRYRPVSFARGGSVVVCERVR